MFGYSDDSVRFWDLSGDSGEEPMQRTTLPSGGESAEFLSYPPDSTRLVFASTFTVTIRNPALIHEDLHTHQPLGEIRYVAVSPEGNHIQSLQETAGISGLGDGTGQSIFEAEIGFKVSFLLWGVWLVVCGNLGTVLNASHLKSGMFALFSGHSISFHRAVYSLDGFYLLLGSKTTLYIYDTDSDMIEPVIVQDVGLCDRNGHLTSVAWSCDDFIWFGTCVS